MSIYQRVVDPTFSDKNTKTSPSCVECSPVPSIGSAAGQPGWVKLKTPAKGCRRSFTLTWKGKKHLNFVNLGFGYMEIRIWNQESKDFHRERGKHILVWQFLDGNWSLETFNPNESSLVMFQSTRKHRARWFFWKKTTSTEKTQGISGQTRGSTLEDHPI